MYRCYVHIGEGLLVCISVLSVSCEMELKSSSSSLIRPLTLTFWLQKIQCWFQLLTFKRTHIMGKNLLTNCDPFLARIIVAIQNGTSLLPKKIFAICVDDGFARCISPVDFEFWFMVSTRCWWLLDIFGEGPKIFTVIKSSGFIMEKSLSARQRPLWRQSCARLLHWSTMWYKSFPMCCQKKHCFYESHFWALLKCPAIRECCNCLCERCQIKGGTNVSKSLLTGRHPAGGLIWLRWDSEQSWSVCIAAERQRHLAAVQGCSLKAEAAKMMLVSCSLIRSMWLA